MALILNNIFRSKLRWIRELLGDKSQFKDDFYINLNLPDGYKKTSLLRVCLKSK